MLIGYTDKLTVSPGSNVAVMVSCDTHEYESSVVRLIHGDMNPAGPGYRAERLADAPHRTHQGREQALRLGSFATVPGVPRVPEATSLSICAWVYATAPGGRRQALCTRYDLDAREGYGLFLEEDGDIALWLGGGQQALHIRTGTPLQPRTWYFVAGVYDSHKRRGSAYQWATSSGLSDGSSHVHKDGLPAVSQAGDPQPPIIFAACLERIGSDPPRTALHFNGRIEAPCLFYDALAEGELRKLAAGEVIPTGLGRQVVGCWDFGKQISSSVIADTSGNGFHGQTVNAPTRGVTGCRWRGYEANFRLAPDEYAAIHFHDDDIEDARWHADFEISVPDGWPSGIYAVELRSKSADEHLPFIVTPSATNGPRADIVFVAPIFSYLAYGDDRLLTDPRRQALLGYSFDDAVAAATDYERQHYLYGINNNLRSLYDRHRDGSQVFFASRLRPLVNMRPKHNQSTLKFAAPHQLNADLYIVDWLTQRRFRFDVTSDEDVHERGYEALASHRVVITGTHPEYCTGPMLDALEEHRRHGGRLMYLGGNGFFWVTSVDPNRRHMIEVRRGWVGFPWYAGPGESYHTTTGERGGVWRFRNRPEGKLLGVASSAEANDSGAPYRRLPDSFDDRVAFIFDGIDTTAPIGDFGLHLGAAGGWELDRFDHALGTPPHALRVASATDFPRTYRALPLDGADDLEPDYPDPRVRADMTYFETPAGGAVFSTGSISWAGSLSANGYENNVSRITENVLRRFADPRPITIDTAWHAHDTGKTGDDGHA